MRNCRIGEGWNTGWFDGMMKRDGMKRPKTYSLYSTCGLETHTRMTASHPESWYSKADGLKRAGVNQVYLATAEMRRFHAPHKPKLAYGERPARTAAFFTGRFGAKQV
jgi:hypothetical protein